jgi:hypothetical protein
LKKGAGKLQLEGEIGLQRIDVFFTKSGPGGGGVRNRNTLECFLVMMMVIMTDANYKLKVYNLGNILLTEE